MHALVRVLLPCAALAVAPGCRKLADTLFVVDAETEEICKTERGLVFPAAPESPFGLSRTITFPLGQVGADLPEGRLQTELRLKFFELNVTGGGANLEGVEYAKVSLRRAGSTEVIRTLLEYNRPAEVLSPTRLTLLGREAVDVPELARDAEVELVFEARGMLPRQEWTADLQACAGLWTRVHYFDLIY